MTLHAHDLERALETLGRDLDLPEPPSIGPAVTAAIAARGTTQRGPRRLVPLLAAAVVLALAFVLVASPGARRAVADWLGIGGVRIEVDDDGVNRSDIGDDLGLGDRSTLEAAQTIAGFELRLPTALGSADEVYVATAEGFTQVSSVYPTAPGTEERVLFVQFRGTPEEAYFKKLIEVEPGIDPVRVDGAPGFWVAGPHELTYRGPDGTLRTDSSRLAANTLVWAENGVTYRLESELPKADAIALAETLE